jgi:hypothetical protein
MKSFFIKLILVALMIIVIVNMINICISLSFNNKPKALEHFIYSVFFSIVGILFNARYKKTLN